MSGKELSVEVAPANPESVGEESLLTVKDPEGFLIVLKTSTWQEHILAQHPEMKKHLDLMQETLQNPQVIQRSSKSKDTFYYYRLTGRSFLKKNDLYLKVVARRKKDKSGFVKTAHLQKELGKGKVIWIQSRPN